MSLKIIKAGLLDTIQDGGRHGYADSGIAPSGPMDPYSAALANAILGKELTEPVIEIHFPAPVIDITSDCILSLTGADFSAFASDMVLPLGQPVLLKKGSRIEFKKPVSGARAYIGIYPGMKLKSWLGSSSTHSRMAVGGWKLMTGDEIETEKLHGRGSGIQVLPWNCRQQWKTEKIRLVHGPEWEMLSVQSREELLSDPFTISALSDRMGFRLKGPVLRVTTRDELLSSAVAAGTIQLLPDGSPVVLMADHPTTGGYPRIAAVTSADLGRLAQMTPGSAVRFAEVDEEEAEELYLRQYRFLLEIKALSGKEMRGFLKR